MFSRELDAAEVSLGTTPLSLKRLPIMNIDTSGADWGTTSMMTIIARAGKTSFSRWETSRGGFISIFRSFSVVSSFMIGGWMNAMAAMYE